LIATKAPPASSESTEIQPLHLGQGELYGSLSVMGPSFGSSGAFLGGNLDTGVSVDSNLTIVGEFNLTANDGAVLTSFQGGVRVNMVKRGRVVPFVVATAGLLHANDGWGDTGNALGFGVGGGFIVRATSHLEAKVELKGYNALIPSGGGMLGWYPVGTVGFGYRF